MVIAGEEYGKDLIILPDNIVICPWRRVSGHDLIIDDIAPVLSAGPDILVVGTGKPGMMVPSPTLCSDLKSHNINMVVLPTDQAVEHYNSLLSKNRKTSACFHLTC
jgi:hypothetical protein